MQMLVGEACHLSYGLYFQFFCRFWEHSYIFCFASPLFHAQTAEQNAIPFMHFAPNVELKYPRHVLLAIGLWKWDGNVAHSVEQSSAN